jgi:peptidoglycan/LPS O-acetylase OafA/YrhL
MATRSEIPPLTGLRGAAALLVVWGHYFFWYSPYPAETVPGGLSWVFGTADYGMTLFFTLSGFVITYNYADYPWRLAPLRSLGRFLFARFSRLYPALLVFIIIALMQSTPTSPGWTALHLFSVQSWLPFQFAGTTTGGGKFHLAWSISTEFGLYWMFAGVALFWAALSRFGRGVRASVFSLLVAVYALTVISLYCAPRLSIWVPSLTPAAFGGVAEDVWHKWFLINSPLSRGLEFSLGSAAALAVLRFGTSLTTYRDRLRWAAAVALSALLLLFYLPLGWLIFGGRLGAWQTQLVAGALFAVIMLNSEDCSRLNRALSCSALLFIGEASYSLYLFHFLIPRFGGFTVDGPFSWPAFGYFCINIAVGLICAIALAHGMYRLVEAPAKQVLRALLQPGSGASRPRSPASRQGLCSQR